MTTASFVRFPPASARKAFPTSCLRFDSVTSAEKVGYSGAISANWLFSARPEMTFTTSRKLIRSSGPSRALSRSETPLVHSCRVFVFP